MNKHLDRMSNPQTVDQTPTAPTPSWRKALLPAVGVIVGLVAAGCSTPPSAPSSDAAASSSSSAVVAPTSSEAVPSRPAGYVSRETWTEGPWPLTVDEAVVDCQGDSIVTVTAEDTEYALNAKASAQGDLPDADAITLRDPNKPGFPVDSKALIAKGLAICGVTPTPARPGSNRAPGLVEKATWTDGPWPFTTDYATIMCASGSGPNRRITVTANREMYALNGTAKSAGLWPDFDPIWLDDPKYPGIKVNIGPMIDLGLSLCKS